uniref:Uncharacterized protein n=1 Tax=Onchocerca volvulus TaxID=6282 RepID=A0A8R1TZH4_ONCVO
MHPVKNNSSLPIVIMHYRFQATSATFRRKIYIGKRIFSS